MNGNHLNWYTEMCVGQSSRSKNGVHCIFSPCMKITLLSAVRFMKRREETIENLDEMKAEMEAVSKTFRIREIWMDNGLEYISESVKAWFRDRGIHPDLNTPYSPEYNGKTELLNRTLLDREMKMLHNSGPSVRDIWADDICTGNHVQNRRFSRDCQANGMTPLEELTGAKTGLRNLRELGCGAVAFIEKQRRDACK